MKTGYEETIVRAFMTAHGDRREDGVMTRLNDRRVDDTHRAMLKRWENYEIVPLDRLDSFLMKYDVMLFELEQWATENFGYDGFVDQLAEPKELVA